MAPSVAHLHGIVAKNARLLKMTAFWKHWKQYTRSLQDTVQASIRSSQAELQPSLARSTVRQPLHPAARLRQSRGRWYTTQSAFSAAVRRITNVTGQSGAAKFDRASLPKSRVGTILSSHAGRSPFSHALRPNLTGGALPRASGGYGLGGSARYFSHTPAAPAQVIHNVSQAVRAFLISGHKAQFDGIDSLSGGKKYKAVTALQAEANRKMNSVPKATPGSYVDFNINPTITALTPLDCLTGFSQQFSPKQSLNTDGLLDVLSVDFSRALKDLSAVLNDLKRLSTIGDLPITYRGTSIRVHFAGCDAETVLKLCDELGVSRGLINQDEDFDVFAGTEIALLFPFAPSQTVSECSFLAKPVENRRFQEPIEWQTMLSAEDISESGFSTRSDPGLGFEEIDVENPCISSPSGYESLHMSEMSSFEHSDAHSPLEYQGFEGIYRFMEACQTPVH